MTFATVFSLAPAPSAAPPSTIGTPTVGSLYHGVFPGASDGYEDFILSTNLDAYEAAVGQRVSWVYFSHEWLHSRAFPVETASWIRARGAVPFIRLMMRSSLELNVPESLFTLESIVHGDFDRDLRAWGNDAQRFASPLIVEWGTEANGQWFSWNGKWHSRRPQLFRSAFRHVRSIIESSGAKNITWVFHVAAHDDPAASWNDLERYYPGDDAVDWLGVSVYGAQTPLQKTWSSFTTTMNEVVPRLTKLAPNKPVFVLEFGHTDGVRESPAGWADAALRDLLSRRWPSVRGFSWWNSAWSNDNTPSHGSEMRVQAIPQLGDVFRQRLSNPWILHRPLIP